LTLPRHAGTIFDGQHLFQIAGNRIQKIDPKTGDVLATIPTPGGGDDSGLAEWACRGSSPMAAISSSAAAEAAGR
jgi:hypothetical protein